MEGGGGRSGSMLGLMMCLRVVGVLLAVGPRFFTATERGLQLYAFKEENCSCNVGLKLRKCRQNNMHGCGIVGTRNQILLRNVSFVKHVVGIRSPPLSAPKRAADRGQQEGGGSTAGGAIGRRDHSGGGAVNSRAPSSVTRR